MNDARSRDRGPAKSEPVAFMAADGVPLAGERRPGRDPAIVLLHAGVADRRAWTDVAVALNRAGAEVISYDRRGFGETPAAGTLDHRADLGHVLAQAAGGPAWLVGNSQGGLIALDLALTEPDRVAGLVLIAPAVSGAPEPDPDGLDAGTIRLNTAIEAAEAAGDAAAVNRLEAKLWLDGPAGPEGRVFGPARELALEMNAIALAAEWPEDAGGGESDTWARLGAIETPATVACGELDLPFFVAQCRVLAERLPNAGPMVTLPGVAHLPGLEAPEMVAALIVEAAGLELRRI